MTKQANRICISLLLLSWSVGQASAADEPREYRVVADESEIHVLVFRAGALGRLGHNHVVTAQNLAGRVTVGETAGESSFELSVPLADLIVDDPEARSASGSAFAGEVSEADRAGTGRNMLGEELLDAERHPMVRVRSTGIAGNFDTMQATVEIRIKGGRHVVELPVNAVFYNERLVATGRATLTHADVGLSPFTAGFGTLRVADELTFRYRIVASAADRGSGDQGAPAVVQHDRVSRANGTAE